MAKQSADQPSVYQLKITLNDIQPPIWRRIQVPSDVPLDVLHVILQFAMGWGDMHLHMFQAGEETYAPQDEEEGFGDFGDHDESEYALNDIAPAEKASFQYTYDMGDSWEHTVVVEKILPEDPEGEYPKCLDGARACPMEDSGGVPGYLEMLDALKNPKHPQHKAVIEWVDEEFDPEFFSVEEINEAFADLDAYLEEMALDEELDPEEIARMLQQGVEVLKSSIERTEKLSNGYLLHLNYDPQAIAMAFQFMLFQHPQIPDLTFAVELGPHDKAQLRITGGKEDVNQIKSMLGLGLH